MTADKQLVQDEHEGRTAFELRCAREDIFRFARLLREVVLHPGLKGTELRDRIYAALPDDVPTVHMGLDDEPHDGKRADCAKCSAADVTTNPTEKS